MSAELAARAEALRAQYKNYESVPGSAYHDDTRNPSRPDLYLAPHRNKDARGNYLPRVSDHLVAFYDHDDREEVHFAGPDATRALDALQAYHAALAKRSAAPATGTDLRLLLRIVPRLKLEDVQGTPRLTVRLGDWNDVLHALGVQGLGVSGAPLVPDGTTP